MGRYLQYAPSETEGYITFLKSARLYGTAAQKLSDIVNNNNSCFVRGKREYQLWLELWGIITRYPNHTKGLQVEHIIRHGINMFSIEAGRLWISLADYYIRRGLFQLARDIYEEGIRTVTTIKDFSSIFVAYSQFEESLLHAKIESRRNQLPKKNSKKTKYNKMDSLFEED